MVVISFEKQKKGERYNLYVDGEFFSGIEPDVIVKYSFKNFMEIEREKLEQIVLESESFYAFNKALKYLSKSMKTENEIRDYLINKSIRKDAVENAILKLIEYKYINDDLYTKNYVDFYKEKYGKIKLKQNLLNKNIDEEIISKYLNYNEEDNLETIILLINKQSKNREIDLKLKQKITRNLLSKGYSFDIIKKGFNMVGNNEDWDWYSRNR